MLISKFFSFFSQYMNVKVLDALENDVSGVGTDSGLVNTKDKNVAS